MSASSVRSLMTRTASACLSLLSLSSAVQLAYIGKVLDIAVHKQQQDLADANQNVREAYSWYASPWGACQRRPDHPVRQREVVCLNIFTGANATNDACDAAKKPCPFTRCYCGAVPCEDANVPEPTCFHNDSSYEALDPPMFVGCLRYPPKARLQADHDGYDFTCMSCRGPDLCHGGLPFFRKILPEASGHSCSRFCAAMGLDISALEPSAGECFCGATSINAGIFHTDHEKTRQCLIFEQDHVLPPGSEHCAVSVYRWGGIYAGGALPPQVVETKAQDDSYIDSIILGRIVTGFDAGDNLNVYYSHAKAHTSKLLEGVVTNTPGWTRNCYPSNCGPGVGPWPKEFTQPLAGVEDKFESYARVRYVFDSNIDDGRKDAFRAAVDRWHIVTCINLVEVDTLADVSTYDVKVVFENDACWVNWIGDISFWTNFAKLNLGWCNSLQQLGSIVHEIGHILGMLHEQARPDATVEYFGKGPYLSLNWDVIGSDWIPQWLPDPNSYVGSADDGTGDPYKGYAPYDFGSVMHYSLSAERGSTIPAWNRELIGNRRALSFGDVSQILDTYQCIPRVSTTTTTTPWYSHWVITQDLGQHHWTGVAPAVELTDNMTCIQSVGYPGSYGITVKGGFTIGGPDANVSVTVVDFSTESGWDYLYVRGAKYSGNNGPSNLVISPGELLLWSSDSLYNSKGWKMCVPEPTGTAPSTSSPTIAPTVPPTSAPTVCDTNNGAVDPYGDGCNVYSIYTHWCGKYDDNDFSSMTMCCGCEAVAPGCTGSTDNGATDPYGDGCDDYDGNEHWCGRYDDSDFSSWTMCCACETPLPTASPTLPPTPSPTPFPTPSPTAFPTPSPTPFPTPSPTPFPTPSPTRSPTPSPTVSPTPEPTVSPTESSPPTVAPTLQCKGKCDRSSTDWVTKCNWDICSGCSDCSNLCDDSCEAITKPWTQKCGFSKCKGCSTCPQGKCKNKCTNELSHVPWTTKCNYKKCEGCIDCLFGAL